MYHKTTDLLKTAFVFFWWYSPAYDTKPEHSTVKILRSVEWYISLDEIKYDAHKEGLYLRVFAVKQTQRNSRPGGQTI